MDIKPWMQNLTTEDMPNEDMKIVSEFLGTCFAIQLMTSFPGFVINIPKTGLIKIRNRYICRNYDGTKRCKLRLCIECEVTERHFRQIISKYREKKDN